MRCTEQRGLYAMTVEMVGWRWAADVILAVSRSRGEGFRVVSELEALRHHIQTSRLPTNTGLLATCCLLFYSDGFGTYSACCTLLWVRNYTPEATPEATPRRLLNFLLTTRNEVSGIEASLVQYVPHVKKRPSMYESANACLLRAPCIEALRSWPTLGLGTVMRGSSQPCKRYLIFSYA
jgi:hypothetical protein